ncbi:MAG: class I SAM-dependent methyltransferase [Propionicimonas sp.]
MSPFDAAHFNEKMMKGVFAKIYPVIAEDLLDRCGIRSGLCLDLGGGPGMLAVRLAEISDLQVIVVDPVAECIELAEENAAEHGQCGQVTAQLGHAEKLDFADNSVDLVVSRGSVYFWDDQAAGLREIYRVLRPGGWAFIGGGFGNAELRDEILATMADDPQWQSGRKERAEKFPPSYFENLLAQVGIDGQVDISDKGSWTTFTKAA